MRKKIIAVVLMTAMCMSRLVFASDHENVSGKAETHKIFLNDFSDRFTLISDKSEAEEGETVNLMVKLPESGYFSDGYAESYFINRFDFGVSSLLDHEAERFGGKSASSPLVPQGQSLDWYDDSDLITSIWGSCMDNAGYYQFTMPDCDVIAWYGIGLDSNYTEGEYDSSYDNIMFKVSCVAVGGGSLSCDKSEVKAGERYTVTATPDEGCYIRDWIHYDNINDIGVGGTLVIGSGKNGSAEWEKYKRLNTEEVYEIATASGEDLSYFNYLAGDELYVVIFGKTDEKDDDSSSKKSSSSSDKNDSSSSDKDDSSSSEKKGKNVKKYPLMEHAQQIRALGLAAETDTEIMREASNGKKITYSVSPSQNGIITVVKGSQFIIDVSGASDFSSPDKKKVAVNKKGMVKARNITGDQGVNISYSVGEKNRSLTVKVVDPAKILEDSGKVSIKKMNLNIDAGTSCNVYLPYLPYNVKTVGITGKNGIIANKADKPEYLYIGKDGKWHFACAGVKNGTAKFVFTVDGKKYTIKVKVNKNKGGKAPKPASSLNI